MNNFDWTFYIEYNNDLTYLKSYKNAHDHWIKYGKSELRKFNRLHIDVDLLNDFDSNYYSKIYILDKNITHLEIYNHWINIGILNNNFYIFRLPNDFNHCNYKKNYNDLSNLSDDELELHYRVYGKLENRIYEYDILTNNEINKIIYDKLPDDFNYEDYKILNNDLELLNDIELKNHFLNNGQFENRIYKYVLPKDFNINYYRLLNPDLNDKTNDELIVHYIKYGKNENRIYTKINIEDDIKFNITLNNNIDENYYFKKIFNETKIFIRNDNKIKYYNSCSFNINNNVEELTYSTTNTLVINNPNINFNYLKYHLNTNIFDILTNSSYDMINLSLLLHEDEFNNILEYPLSVIDDNYYNNLDCFFITANGGKKILENKNNNNSIFNNFKKGVLTRPLFNYILSDNENKKFISNILFNIYYDITNKINKIYCISLGIDIYKKKNMEKYCNMLNNNYSNFFYKGILGINLPSINTLIKMNIYDENILSSLDIYKLPPKIGAIGLNIAQSNIFKDAIYNNYEYILILEDDISFKNEYYKVLYKIFEKYENNDIIYLGFSNNEPNINKYLDLTDIIYNYKIYKPKNNILNKVCIGGFFAVILSKKAIKILNSRFTPINNISDILLCDIAFNIKNDYSDNIMYKTNYNLNTIFVDNLFNVDINKISLTDNLASSNITLFTNKKIKYLSKIKKIKFIIENNYPLKIYVSSTIKNYYNVILKIILSKFIYYEIINNIDKDTNISIYSVADYIDLNTNCLNICLNGEKEDSQEETDIAILTTKKFKYSFNIYFPHLYQSLWERKLDYFTYLSNSKKYFCAYMYSYDVPYRVEIFNEVSKYKNVTALGKSCNNIEETDRGIYNENITYNDLAVQKYSDYKFVLALENSIEIGYLTEKLINPILANSIPIYAGPPDIFDIINKNRIIYVYDFLNFNELNKYIEKIDNDNILYDLTINENIFTGKLSYNNFYDYLNNKIEKSLGLQPRNIIINNNNNNNIEIEKYDDIDMILNNIDNINKDDINNYLSDFIESFDNIVL